MSFGKRPVEELYDIVADPDCVNNLAGLAGEAAVQGALRHQLEAELAAQGDPRVLGRGTGIASAADKKTQPP